MKFKNYVNSHTGDNRIYSLSDITKMALGDVLKNKEELLSQYRVLGVPTEQELQNSDNVVYVQAYTRDDGTEVKAHYRSKPEGGSDNNTNSLSGTPTGGASEISAIKEDGIIIKSAAKINEEKNKLIEYNNRKNVNNKDARELMNIAIIGTDNIDNTKELSVLNNSEVQSLSKELEYNLYDGDKTVKFSKDSTITKAVEASDSLHSSINKWIKTPEENRSDRISVKIADDNNLFRSINNATILKPHIENNYFCGYLYDKYDFKLQWFKDFETMKANTGAYLLQTAKQIENYNIIIPIKIKL